MSQSSDDLPQAENPTPEQPPGDPQAPAMEIRDILDTENNVIGQLTLPEGTSEDVWALALAAYSTTPPVVELTPEQMAKRAIDFGMSIIVRLGAEPELNNLSTEQMVQLITLAGPIQLMLMVGALGTALAALQQTDFTGVISPELVGKYIGLLEEFLGV